MQSDQVMPIEVEKTAQIIAKINAEKRGGSEHWHLPSVADIKAFYAIIQRAGLDAYLTTQDIWYYVEEPSTNLYQLEMNRLAQGKKGCLLMVRQNN